MADQALVDIGTMLAGRYKLTARIGEGGFGKIFKARQINMDREVAIKLLPRQFAAMPNIVERFRREARLASRLNHPNTITLHDYGQEEDLFFIVMEYLRGQDLADRLQTTPKLSVAQACHIARQTLSSLQEAHKHGIIHRDLKPENIFLTAMGDDLDYVKVLDFGIATLAEPGAAISSSGRQLTIQGSTVGTPTYMSPEQAAGEPVARQSDLYSLGVILFEMLNGAPPFDDERPLRVMRAHLFEPLPAFAEKSLRNTRIESLVRKAMAKDPADRFADAAEFLQALSEKNLDKPAIGFVQLGTSDVRPRRNEPISEEVLPTLRDRIYTTPSHHLSVEDDRIPFDVVPSEEEVKDEEEEEDKSAPQGFYAESSSNTSSIITVVEEPAEADVIVLTERKETPKPLTSLSRSSQDDWSWSEDLAQADASGSQILTDHKPIDSRRPALALFSMLLALVLLAILALGGWIPLPF